MASYFTKSEARAFAPRTLQKSFTASSQQALSRAVKAATDADRFDIFLSHASKDAELILGVKGLLESQGLTVYVDWVDDPNTDRTKVNRENADLLRRRMRQSSSLIWVGTEAASASKWMPWELGYFDGFKPDLVAILPLMDSPGEAFKGQEYLGLYPIVRKDTYANGTGDVFVEDIGRKWTTLAVFGKGKSAWSKYSTP